MSRWMVHLGFPETRGTFGFLLVYIIDAFGAGLFLPLSILYFQVATDIALPIIGLTLTIATVCTLPVTFATGSLVDRFGARRMTAASQYIQAIGFLGYLFVHSVPFLLLTALLVTAGTRMFYAAHTTLVVEIAAPHERDRWYGLIGAIRNVGLGGGGFLAGIVLMMNDLNIYRLLIGSSFACYLMAGSLLLCQPEPRYRRAGRSEQAKSVHYGVVLRNRLFLGFLISNVSFPLCGLMLGTALPIYVTRAAHAPGWIVGAVLVMNALLGIGGQTLVVRLLEPYRRTRAIGVAALLWCGACGLFALALIIPRFLLIPYLFLAAILYTLASLAYLPMASALVANLGPTELRGRYLATYEFSWGVASALTPALFTALYAVAPALPWIVLAVLTCASGMSVLWLEQRLPAQAVRTGPQSEQWLD